MADLTIKGAPLERMVGSGHPTYADTLNRLALVEHNNDGTHNKLTQVKDPYVDVRAYGAVGDGVADDTTAITNAISAASTAKCGVLFASNKTYLTSPISILGTGSVPLFIDMNGSTLKAKVGSTGVFVTVENPHTLITGFTFGNGTIDANGQCSIGWKLHGSQHGNYINFHVINSTGVGIHISGESGYGIYYNKFENILSGKSGSSNGSHGWNVVGIGGNYIANNTLMVCKSQFNKGDGWVINWASNVYVGCSAEKNDTYGFNIDNTYSTTFNGGYSESNHQNWATGGVSDGGTDEGFILTANSLGVKIIGGRHIGTIGGTTSGQGNIFLPDNYTQATPPTIDETGKLTANSLSVRTGGGIGIGGASAIANTVNLLANGGIAASGTNAIVVNTTDVRIMLPAKVQDTNARLYAGAGSPEGVLTGAIGSIYLRTNGGALTSMYVKESGAGNTGWVGK